MMPVVLIHRYARPPPQAQQLLQFEIVVVEYHDLRMTDADIHCLLDPARIRIHQFPLGEAVLRYVLERLPRPRILPFPSQGLQGLFVVIHDDLIDRIATGTTVLRTLHRDHDPSFELLQNISMPPVVDLRILRPSVIHGVHGHELGLVLVEPIRYEYGNEILV